MVTPGQVALILQRGLANGATAEVKNTTHSSACSSFHRESQSRVPLSRKDESDDEEATKKMSPKTGPFLTAL